MDWTWQPGIFVLVSVLLVLFFEVKAFPHKGGTISEGVWEFERWARVNAPYTLVFVGLLIGTLLGHLFWAPCEYFK